MRLKKLYHKKSVVVGYEIAGIDAVIPLFPRWNSGFKSARDLSVNEMFQRLGAPTEPTRNFFRWSSRLPDPLRQRKRAALKAALEKFS